MTQVLLAFVGATLVIVLSPGPDTLLVLRNAAAGGRRAAAWTTLGILVGGLAWLVAVVAGLAALIRSSEAVYGSLRYLGAAYLAYLGARSLWGWWRDERRPSFPSTPSSLSTPSGSADGALAADPALAGGTARRAAWCTAGGCWRKPDSIPMRHRPQCPTAILLPACCQQSTRAHAASSARVLDCA